MKQYYKVSFQYSEDVYCTNIAHAETAADVEALYSQYEWVDVKEARRRGMPIIEVEPQQAEEAQEETNNEQEEKNMNANIKNPTITLSTGETYTPEKGKTPVNPCFKCKEKHLAEWGQCNAGFGVCAAYMDYEHMNSIYKTAVF